jgi:hypothetical protein
MSSHSLIHVPQNVFFLTFIASVLYVIIYTKGYQQIFLMIENIEFDNFMIS